MQIFASLSLHMQVSLSLSLYPPTYTRVSIYCSDRSAYIQWPTASLQTNNTAAIFADLGVKCKRPPTENGTEWAADQPS